MNGHYSPLLDMEFVVFVFQVYAGVTEFSFEELRAIEYLKGNRPERHKQGRKMKPAIIPFIVQHNGCVIDFHCLYYSKFQSSAKSLCL